MPRLVKEIHTGYLKSRYIKDIVQEVAGLPLEDSAEAFLKTVRGRPKALTMEQAGAAIHLLMPLLGVPTYFDGWVLIPNGKYFDISGSSMGSGKIISWKVSYLGEAIRASNLLEVNGFTSFSNNRSNLQISTYASVHVPILIKSQDPKVWSEVSEKKWVALKKNRQLRAVRKKLDR